MVSKYDMERFNRRPDLMEAAAIGFDAAVASMQYEDGTPLDVTRVINPFRPLPTGNPWLDADGPIRATLRGGEE